MKKRIANKVGSVITFIVLLLLFIVGLSFIIKFTGVDKYFGDFRIEYDGKTITGTENQLMFPADSKATFYVKGTNGYTVEVKPNAEFEYEVSGLTFKFEDEDFSGLVDGVYEDCFIVAIPFTAEEFLSEIWNGEIVTVPKDIPDYLYKIVITSSSDGKVIEIAVRSYRFVGGVELDKDHLYF